MAISRRRCRLSRDARDRMAYCAPGVLVQRPAAAFVAAGVQPAYARSAAGCRSDPTTDVTNMNLAINPLIAAGVLASTAVTDAAYVFFNAAVSSRRRIWAAN